MATEREFRALFESVHRIVQADPIHTPQVLALLLAGGPFRPFLERPELMNKVILMAKNFVAEAQKDQQMAKQDAAKTIAKERAAATVAPHHRRV